MPAFLVLEQRNAFAFVRLRDDGARKIAGLAAAFLERSHDLVVVMAIDRHRKPSKRPEFSGELVHIQAIHRVLALPQAVDIDDRVEV